jgi:hypothetical protein
MALSGSAGGAASRQVSVGRVVLVSNPTAIGILVQRVFGPDTSHGLREKPCVAFNEGFADYAQIVDSSNDDEPHQLYGC